MLALVSEQLDRILLHLQRNLRQVITHQGLIDISTCLSSIARRVSYQLNGSSRGIQFEVLPPKAATLALHSQAIRYFLS
ncbi:Uncharacterized protein TCM_002399 [Theobroma cacao]|uniref:Uncharacterized protein n=1 Tax=Theobroma cacao TaxID=3641 RepID=A0A061DLC6_THECC|nr:Uncharacterized protein TCM_002399 [Theobroma cacao]